MSAGSASVPQTIHACSVVVGTIGILIRGRSGAGKSTLCDLLVEAAAAKGHFAAHVSDDRTCLRHANGQLIASPAPSIAGKLEVRGLGLVRTPYEPEAVIRLVADLLPAADIERLPEPTSATTELEGIRLPAVQLEEGGHLENLRRFRWAIRQLFPKCPDYL